MKTLTLFVSSPGDVGLEHRMAEAVIEKLQARYWNFVRLETVSPGEEWLGASGRWRSDRPRPGACDIVVGILWHRLGTPLSPESGETDGASGAERDLNDAVASYEGAVASGTSADDARPYVIVYKKTALRKSEPDLEEEKRAREESARLAAFERNFFFHPDGTAKRALFPFADSAEFEQLLEAHLGEIIRSELAHVAGHGGEIPRVPVDGSPFRGLRPFDVGDAALFFGRYRATESALDQLRWQRAAGHAFLMIHGGSGVGKSSLMRAGVAARLMEPGSVPEADVWTHTALSPASGPGTLCENLARALTSPGALPELSEVPHDDRMASAWDEDLLAAALDRDAGRCFDAISSALDAAAAGDATLPPGRRRAPCAHLCLLLDQFDEIFVRAEKDQGERERFFHALARLGTHPRVWIVASMRSDAFPRLAASEAMRSLTAKEGSFLLTPPEAPELRQMIRNPARAAGLEFEIDPGSGECLSDRLLEEMRRQPAALPLLQFCLEELRRRRRAEAGHLLTWVTYREVGELPGAIATAAYRTWNRLSEPVRALKDRFFAEIVATDGEETEVMGRKFSPVASIHALGDEAREFIQAHLEAGLLVAETERPPAPGLGKSGGSTRGDRRLIAIAHEILFEQWGELRDWSEHHRRLIAARRRLREQTGRWLRREKAPGLLLRGARLAEAIEVEESGRFTLTESEREWIARSRKRSRIAGLLERGTLIGVAVIALIAAWAAWSNGRARERAEAMAQAAEDANRALVAQRTGESPTLPFFARRAAAFYGDPSRGGGVRSDARYRARFREMETLAAGQGENAISPLPIWHGFLPRARHFINRELPPADLQVRLREEAAVRSVALGPGDSWIALSYPGAVCLLRGRNPDPILTVAPRGVAGEIGELSLSPDRRFLAASFLPEDPALLNFIQIWRIETGEDGLLQLVEEKRLPHSGVRHVAWSRDGRWVVSSDSPEPTGSSTVFCWSTKYDFAESWRKRIDGAVRDLAISPDGEWIAVAADETLGVIEVGSRQFFPLSERGDLNRAVDFNGAGTLLACGTVRGQISVWRRKSSRPFFDVVVDRKPVGSPVVSCRFHPEDRNFLATGAEGGRVALWRLKHGSELSLEATLLADSNPHDTPAIEALAFSSNRDHLYTGQRHGSLRIWDLQRVTSTEIGAGGAVDSIDFNEATGQLLVARSREESANVSRTQFTLRQIDDDFSEGLTLFSTRVPAAGRAVRGSARLLPGGNRAILFRRPLNPESPEYSLFLQDLNRMEMLSSRTMRDGSGELLRRPLLCAFSARVDHILVVTEEAAAYVADWDSRENALPEIFDLRSRVEEPLGPGAVRGAALSADGSRGVVVGEIGEDTSPLVQLFATSGPLSSRRVEGLGGGPALAAAFHPGGGRFAVGLGDGGVALIDSASGEVKKTLGGDGVGVRALAYDREGSRLAAGTPTAIRVLDGETGRELRSIPVPEREVRSLAWIDERRILAGSGDGTLKLWTLPEGSIDLSRYRARGWLIENERTGGLEWNPELRAIESGFIEGDGD